MVEAYTSRGTRKAVFALIYVKESRRLVAYAFVGFHIWWRLPGSGACHGLAQPWREYDEPVDYRCSTTPVY